MDALAATLASCGRLGNKRSCTVRISAGSTYALVQAAGPGADELLGALALSWELFTLAVLGPDFGYVMADGRPVWLRASTIHPPERLGSVVSEASLVAMDDMGPDDRARLAAYCATSGLEHRIHVYDGHFGETIVVEFAPAT